MHSAPMADSEGDFGLWKPTKDDNPAFKCRKCGSRDVVYRVWDSSCGGYEDYQYHCRGCQRKWWVEGSDS
jgi:DNA-directed RNA polymerase subunit M/transcription elongation factor TFIIS